MLDLVCINEVIEIVAETCGNEYNASGGCVNDGQCQESRNPPCYVSDLP